MAREDRLIDEGVAFGRRRTNTSTTPATAAEVQAAIDAASTELGTDRAIPGEAAANLFAPIGGGATPGDASAADQELFVSEGYNTGTLPPEYQALFGNDPDVIGYKISTNPDGSQSITVAKEQGDADGGLQFQTYGASFKTDASGKIVPFVKSATGNNNLGDGNDSKDGVYTASDGKIFTNLNAYNAYVTKLKTDEKARAGKSAYDILYNEFNRYGMGSLIEPLKKFIQDGLSKDELTLKLRETPQYQERFAANALRIKNGFAAIDEATYLGLEDKYQSIMQNYGLPASYYERGALGKQAGFENLIGGNVDPITLEERIMEGQKVVKGSKEIKDTIGQFYPGINNSDFLAYVLDPKNALAEIKRKVAAAEIGGSAIQSGLTTNVGRAEELVAQGITKAQAQQGYGTIGGGLQRGSQLASIYGESPYTQTTAEKEVFGLAGKTEAEKERKKITGLEKATFGAKTGISSGALSRDRAGAT